MRIYFLHKIFFHLPRDLLEHIENKRMRPKSLKWQKWLRRRIKYSFANNEINMKFIIIIIIMSRLQHGSPWSSLITCLYCPSLPAGIQIYILYQQRAVAYRFQLVVLPLHVHVNGSTVVRRLWVLPHFSSVPHVWFVLIGYFSWWLEGDRTAAALSGAAFLCKCRQDFSSDV